MASHGLVHRAYQGEADLIWALFQNTHFDPHRAIELWESIDGRLVGFGLFEDGDFDTQCFVPSSDQQITFESEALNLARDRARQAGAGALRTEILASDALRADLLIAEGFVPDEARVTSRGERNTGTLRLRQSLASESLQGKSLDHSSEKAVPAPRFLVRSVADEEEWAERVQLHQTVWAPSRVTLEAYRRLRAAPIYRPDLDLVAVASDGMFAAYAIVWYDPSSRVGEFEPVGTHPDFRRRGIGRAVMLEGLHRLRTLGARQALVSSSADNPASIRLYESVGFAVADRGRFYHGRL
jgi:mycothiol synthase